MHTYDLSLRVLTWRVGRNLDQVSDMYAHASLG